MKAVLYLHGLESTQGGKKVDFLADNFFVHAPDMDYRDPDSYNRLHKLVVKSTPDIIVGSSMGGYFATLLSMNSYRGASLVLFNPALHSRTEEPPLPKWLKYTEYLPEKTHNLVKGTIILGVQDQLIPAERTYQMFEKNDRVNVIPIEDMFHRTPFDVFKSTFNEIAYIQ